ncbi:MAG: protein translocase subunit SecD [Alphaproteobacteria bacterium]|nr:protein translocase subunit SecD [Alphaproteobacteria bacterium]
MLHVSKWKIILSLFLTVMGVIYAAPNLVPAERLAWMRENLPSSMPVNTVNLGLDLRGGSHLLYQADVSAVLKERVQSMVTTARTELRREDIAFSALSSSASGITFTLTHPREDHEDAYQIARDLEDGVIVDIDDDSGKVTVAMSDATLSQLRTTVMSQAIEIIRRRVDESGTREPLIQRQGVDRIVVQLPGVDNPDEIKNLIGKTAKMSFHLLDEDAVDQRARPGFSRRLPMRDTPGAYIVVKNRVMLSGDLLVHAQATFQEGAPVVSFKFNDVGAKRFCNVTRENVQKPFAIVLDKEVISAPVINEPICGGQGIISGRFTVSEANNLSVLLRSGALPAPLEIVEERTVGPTLGSDSIAAGKLAAMTAFGGVIVLMVSSYGLFGVFASAALTLNVCFIFALLSMLQATLTLPGIAGIILTMGIAVDTNVLIYERIREELRNGRSVMSSVDTGYRHAMGTIIDSNLTTLIVALILFSFGSGPVKGFAVAMTIGILTSLFSGTMMTRLMIIGWLKKAKPSELVL